MSTRTLSLVFAVFLISLYLVKLWSCGSNFTAWHTFLIILCIALRNHLSDIIMIGQHNWRIVDWWPIHMLFWLVPSIPICFPISTPNKKQTSWRKVTKVICVWQKVKKKQYFFKVTVKLLDKAGFLSFLITVAAKYRNSTPSMNVTLTRGGGLSK